MWNMIIENHVCLGQATTRFDRNNTLAEAIGLWNASINTALQERKNSSHLEA